MLKTTMALAIVMALGTASAAHATVQHPSADVGSVRWTPQDQQTTSAEKEADEVKKAKKLEAVTVTGSLIPQTQIETAQPVTTITAEDLKARGFSTVAQALQQASFSTGSVQGAQSTNSFTTGAETLSLFGLPVGFTKYLIDGRPMGNFPGLYNGSDTFNSISGIPIDMVDHIDILPGGQSSLYGSDAIAGVINIVLKKRIDAPTVDARYGWYPEGGGADRRVSFADSFTVGKFTSLIGVQFESAQPIWGKDRDLTRQFYKEGTTPQTASRDYLVLSAGGADSGYLFLDPNNCATVAGGFDGTIGKRTRRGSGDYCGSFYSPGEGTLSNSKKQANLYTHNTFEVNESLQLYGDLLYNYDEQKFTNGSGTSFWSSSLYASAPGSYFYDDRRGDLPLIQHGFTPEEVGGFSHVMNKQYENSYMLTLGGRGTFGDSDWDYDLGFTHSDDKLINRNFQRFTGPLEAYYQNKVLGPQMGTYYGYPVFEPNYAALYNPVSRDDFRSFTGYTTSRAKTWDNMLRGQLTNASLFSLPGGDAGVAVVLEGGNQGWDSSPDQRLLSTITDVYGNTSPEVWGTSAVPGAGHRSRYAATTEFKLPIIKQITFDAAGRYDNYRVSGKNVHHATYNLGLEYRPFDTLLLRGRYGTAFKAPTLSDQYQGVSGYYNSVYDYANCGRLGFSGPTEANCPAPYNSTQFNGTTQGNPNLEPITAKVWSYGFAWAPLDRMSLTADYYHYDISNEVQQLSSDQLSNTQFLCDTGGLNANSPTCTQAFTQVTRGPGVTINGVPLLGQITDISTPKQNVANELVNAVAVNFSYGHRVGSYGNLSYNVSYSDVLKHNHQDYATDPVIDYLRHPNYSTDFKTKVNASITWNNDQWSTTLYANRQGSTPNYAAFRADNYTATGAGKLAPWIRWNASFTFSPTKDLGLSLLVNNMFNAMPPKDHTYPGTEGRPYDETNYNVYGRAIYLEANYKFGSVN